MQERTRRRNRAFAGSISYQSTRLSDGAIDYSATWPYSREYVLSSIQDTVGNKGGQNPVSHVRVNWTDAAYSPPVDTPTSSPSIRVAYRNSSLLASWGGPPLPACPSVDFTSCVNSLIRDAAGSMPASANLVVNALEFASLKTLVPSLLKGFKSIARRKLGRRSLKDLAGSHLAYSFGLAPLIRDFRGFLDIRGNVRKRMEALERRNGVTTRLTVRGSPVTGTSTTIYTPYTGGGGTHTSTTVWDWKVTPCVSADVFGWFIRNNSSTWKLYSSALGLSSPLQNIWEIIPSSCIADWFIPIGEMFLRLEDKLGFHSTVLNLSMSNWMSSVLFEASGKSTVVVTNSVYPKWNNLKYTGVGCDYRSYGRSAGIPATGMLADPSGWSVSKTALSISLIAQKVIK